jgi:hypothetical protein
MSLSGKASLSIRKKDVKEQKSIAIGFKNLMFAHKATSGDSGINLNSLVAPTEMTGFVNPSVADLQTARLMFFRKNLRLVSSLRGELIDYLSYEVASSTQINFVDFTAEDGEIFVGVVEAKPITGPIVVEARPIAATGLLDVGVNDFAVGTPFEVNKFPTQQVGAVLVYRNGLLQARNTGNSDTILDANYYEEDAGNGLGSVIHFNNAPVGQADNIMVVSNGLLAERPTGSMMAEIEALAGQLDRVIPVLADVSGLDETEFQSAPNNQDLLQFGDRVIALTNIQFPIQTAWATYTPVFTGFGSPTNIEFEWRRVGDTLHVRGRFQSGTTTATEARLSLPAIPTQTSTLMRAGIYFRNNAGAAAVDKGGVILIESQVGYVTFGDNAQFSSTNNANWDAKVNASPGVASVNDRLSIEFQVKIDGWLATQSVAEQLGL